MVMLLNFFKKLIYYIIWMIKYLIFKQKIPLSGSIIITDKCNLHCKHCIVSNLGYKDMDFEEVKRDLKTLYDKGCRILVITGGEPFLWKDKMYDLDDVIDYTKKLGFFRTVVCTNGTIELESKADYLWVSMDGLPEDHDNLRGNAVFQKITKNILRSTHKNIYVNFTVSKFNITNFNESIKNIFSYKKIKGILFHFFTPYIGLENTKLKLTKDERDKVINKILKIKRKHPLRISNTFAGLKALKRDNWKRPTWASVVLNQGELTICCCRKGICDEEVCKNCGCTPAVETWVLQELKPGAIIENLRFL
ncbi:radical SAM protein [candidate division WOR-3 bacterium]|nr:radical SAM protein [candidate division WOR-3 bacterium]